ncbi:MAG: hypothetical protein JWQ35_2718 [Bacteriovoracaceae bacterium]|nr:hypothetical protein [Bacteriovoracaceae bacterium]
MIRVIKGISLNRVFGVIPFFLAFAFSISAQTAETESCPKTLVYLSANDVIADLPYSREEFREINDLDLFTNLLKRRNQEDVNKLAMSFTRTLMKRMSEARILLNNNDYADVFRELFLEGRKLISKFDLEKAKNFQGKTIKEKLAIYLSSELRHEANKYWTPKPKGFRGRHEMTKIRSYRWIQYASDIQLESDSRGKDIEKLDLLEYLEATQSDLRETEWSLARKFYIEELRLFFDALKNKYGANSTEFQYFEAILTLRWLQGDQELAKETGLLYQVPFLKRSTSYKDVEWSTEDVADRVALSKGRVNQIDLALKREFKYFQDHGSLSTEGKLPVKVLRFKRARIAKVAANDSAAPTRKERHKLLEVALLKAHDEFPTYGYVGLFGVLSKNSDLKLTERKVQIAMKRLGIKRDVSEHDAKEKKLKDQIEEILKEHPSYGYTLVHRSLVQSAPDLAVGMVQAIMEKYQFTRKLPDQENPAQAPESLITP